MRNNSWPSIMDKVERAYNDASDCGQPRVLVIPTSDVLPPVDPIRVASQFTFSANLAVNVLSGSLVDFCQNPTREQLDKVVTELTVMRDNW